MVHRKKEKRTDLVRMFAWVEPEVDQAIDIAAAHLRMSKNAIVEEAMRDFLKRKLHECRRQNLWPVGEEVIAVRPADRSSESAGA